MNPIVASLLEFNEALEIPKLDKPDLGPEEMIELRSKLLWYCLIVIRLEITNEDFILIY